MDSLFEDEEETEGIYRLQGSLQKRMQKLYTALIAAFSRHSKQSKAYRTQVCLSLCLSFVAAMQGMSLVLVRSDAIAEYEEMKKVFALVNYVRVDTLAVDLGVEYEFFYVLLAIVYAPIGILAVNVGLLLSCKKKPHWLLVKAMSLLLTLIEQVLLLPMLIMMLSCIKYTYFSSSNSMFEYGNSQNVLRSDGLAFISLLTIPLLMGLLYINSYFFYENVYAKRRKFVSAMRDSFAHRMDLLTRLGTALCYSVLSEMSQIWYRLGVLFLCATMVFMYTARLPYYNAVINVGYASRKVLIAWSVVAYFIGWSTDSASCIVILILFVSPVIVLLNYDRTVEKLRVVGRTPVDSLVTDYQVELKLRTMLEAWEAKESPEATCTAIEQLFDFATRNFPKSPLLPIWEAQYYHYYKRNTALALLKLSKLHTSDDHFEAQFLANTLEAKLSALEVLPERLYFRYLKLLSEAKRTDESCCLQLVATCSELLSKKVNAGKFESLVRNLSSEISRTMEKYFKLQKLYPENEEVLQLLGSFMCEIVKEAEGRAFLTRVRMVKSSEAHRVSNANLFSGANGLVVLSCCLNHQGEIILANQKVYEMFKYSKIDLHKKPISHFMPEEYRQIYTQTMNSVVLFGRWLDDYNRLFAFLLDYEGYLMPAKVTAKLTTWDNKPHIILSISKLADTDWVLVDRDWKVRAHSCLDPQASRRFIYIGCELEEVLPGLHPCIGKFEQSFHYNWQGHWPATVTIEETLFRDVLFRLISLRRSRSNPDLSPMNSEINYLPNASSKEVRFHAEKDLLVSIEPRPEPIPVYDSATTVMFSETQARVNKKMDLTASLSGSTASSGSVELQEGAKVGKSLKRVKLLLILSFLMLVTGLIASVIFLTSILTSLESITTIRQYADRNMEIIKIAYDTRSLILSDSPLFPYDPPTLLAGLEASAQKLDKLVAYMKGQMEEGDASPLHLSTPLWFKLETSYNFRLQSFLDALYAYTAAATRLTASSPPYSQLADAYFLFNNGISDLLLLGNMTLGEQVDAEKTSNLHDLESIKYLLYMCCVLAVLPLVLLVAPQFYQFEQQSKAVWSSIYALPIDLVLEIRTNALDRLQNYFSNEVVLDTATSAKSTERKVASTRLWPGFALRLCVYFCLSLVFFIVIELVYFLPLNDLALTIPHYLYWMSMRSTYLYEGLLWGRERVLPQDFSYTELYREGQHWTVPAERVLTAAASVMYINKLLYFGSAETNIYTTKKSDQYLDFIMVNCCEEIAVERCADSPAALGMVYLIRDWNHMLRALQPTANQAFSLIEAQEKATATGILSIEYAIEYYRKDAIDQIRAISMQIVTFAMCFIGAVFALYATLYRRYLTALLTRARQALRVLKLLRRAKTD